MTVESREPNVVGLNKNDASSPCDNHLYVHFDRDRRLVSAYGTLYQITFDSRYPQLAYLETLLMSK